MLTLLYLISGLSSGAVIGIDLGSEYFKTSLIRPGKRLQIVENEQSKRSTPYAISFTPKGREYGFNALREQAKRPDLTFTFTHNLLSNTSLSHLSRTFQPIEVSKNSTRDSWVVKVPQEDLEIEEITAMILEHIREMSEKFGETSIKDCSITVPSFWDRAQKIALINSAQAAGLNVLALINENTAAAFYYGIDRFDNETEHYAIFYNLGASYLQVAVAKYNTANATVSEQNKIIENIEVLAQTYDKTLGGSNFDSALAEFFAEKFEEMHKINVKDQLKVMGRLFSQANSVKKILSANKMTNVIVNNLYKGIDFKYSLARDEFDKIVARFEERLILPIYKALEIAGVDKSQIGFFEVIGGASRVPKVQELIKEKTGFDISTHLNGDEAMAHGSALYAANFSSSAQIKPILLADLNQNTYRASVFESESGTLIKQEEIFNHTHRFGSYIYLSVDSKKNLRVQFDQVENDLVRPIVDYEIYGVENVTVENFTQVFLVVLDWNGIIYLYSASAAYEEKVLRNVTVPVIKPKVNMTASENAEENKENSTEEIAEVKQEWKTEQKSIKLKPYYKDLDWPKGLLTEDLKNIRNKLISYKDVEKKARELAEAKNDIESYIYFLSDKLEESVFELVTSPEQRTSFAESISTVKDWMESSEFESSTISDVKERKSSLEATFSSALLRETELDKRSYSVEKSLKDLNKYQEELFKLNETKPWIPEYEVNLTGWNINNTLEWINNKTQEQTVLNLWEELAFTTDQLEAKVKRIESQIERLKRMTKPKGKKPYVPEFVNFGEDFDWEQFKKKYGKDKPEDADKPQTEEGNEQPEKSEKESETDNETKDDL